MKCKREEGSWDCGLDFEKARRALERALREAPPREKPYYYILLIQLVNGARVSEAIQAYKAFLETGRRDIHIQARKHGGRRRVRIPGVVRRSQVDRWVLTIPDGRLRRRLTYYVKKVFGPEATTHSLRYALIGYLSRRGVAPQVIARITGHRKLDYVVHYTQQAQADAILDEVAK